jgi:SAM-dependent methyltransferase
VICDDAARAAAICHIAGKNLFYARLPDVKGTAGTAAIMSDEVLRARPAYEWTLNHVIEHVIDPRRMLERCYALLRPGGILALATVNRDSWCHARFREHWRGLEVPRHLWIFTRDSMDAVISGAGFGATKVWDTADGTTFFYHESQLIQDRALRGGQDEQARFRSHVSRALFGRLRPLTSVVQRGQGEELFAHARKLGTDPRP